MSGRASSRRPRPVERGGISWVTLLLLAVVVGCAYLGYVWLPLQFDHYAVKQVVRDYMNQAIKNPDDDALRRNMVAKIRSLVEVETLDPAGRLVRVAAIDLDERQVTWERDSSAQTPMLRIAFEYERQVVYPYLDRTDVKVFTTDMTQDLARADWGPAR